MSSTPSTASLSASETSKPTSLAGIVAQNDHAKSAVNSSLRRKIQRNAAAKASKHSPLLKDLKIRSLMRNFNLKNPASAAALTDVSGWADDDIFSGTTSDRLLMRNFDPDSPASPTALTGISGNADEDPFSGSKSIPPMLQSPQPFRDVERICKLVQHYVSGSFDAQTWPIIPEQFGGVMNPQGRSDVQERGVDAMNKFYSLHVAAYRLLQSSSSNGPSQGYDLMDKAYDQFRPMIKQHHHNTLLQLFSALVLFENPGPMFDLRLRGLGFFQKMAATILGLDHPITGIISVLGTVDEFAITRTIAQAWEVLVSSFEQNLSVTHHVSLNCRLRMIELIFVKPGKYEEAERLLKKLLATAVAGREAKDIQSASIEYSLAKMLLHQTQPAKCAELAYSIIDRCQNAPKEVEYAAAALESSAYQLVATAYVQLGQRVAAESCLRQYVQIRVSKWGLQSPIALHALDSLEEFLIVMQKHEEAAVITLQRLSIMNQLRFPSRREGH